MIKYFFVIDCTFLILKKELGRYLPAQSKGIVYEASPIRRTKYFMIGFERLNQGLPEIIIIGNAVETGLIHVCFDPLNVAR